MKSKLIFSAFILFSSFLKAEEAAVPAIPPVAIVSKMSGEVFFNGQKLKMNDKLDKAGNIETKEKSFVQLKIEKWKNTITIGPSSKMSVNLADEKKYTFEDGSCRWKSYDVNKDPNAAKGAVHTKYASMGVRGTDFTIKNTSLLGETELYMFDGEVEFSNPKDTKDRVVAKKGQWVGIGGRFGDKVSKVIEIPEPLFKVLSEDLK